MAILTLGGYEALRGITATYNDALFSAIIPVVNAAIETKCNRVFDKVEKVEWFEDITKPILLSSHPVDTIIGVCETPSEAFHGTKPLAQLSTISTSPTRITFNSITNGVVTAAGDPYSTTAIISGVVAGAQASGWNMTYDAACAAYPSKWLRPNQVVTEDESIEYCDPQDFVKAGIVSGTNRMLDICPSSPVMCHYIGGYGPGEIPLDLQMIAANIVSEMAKASEQASGIMKSETISEYSYTLADGGKILLGKLVADAAGTLLPYTNID